MIEPTDKKIPYIGSMMVSTTYDGVNEWLGALNQNSSIPVWNINEIIIPVSIQKTYNYTNCDIPVRYLPQPKNQTDTLETVGQISLDLQNNKTRIEVYYLQIVNKIVPSEDYGYSSVESYSDKPVDYYRLKQAISHELGHAFGLSHYITTDTAAMQRWGQGLEKPPSIMVAVQGENAKYYGITENDVRQIVSKYGNNGFGGNNTFGLGHDILRSNKQDLSNVVPTLEPSYCPKDNSLSSGFAPLLTKEEVNTGTAFLFTYSPEKLYNGCGNSWTFNFVNEKNSAQHLSNVYYDILMQQDVMRSVAKEEGKKYFFTSNGTATNYITIKEKTGVINFWVVTFEGQPDNYTEGKISGSALLLLKVRPIPTTTLPVQQDIPPWIKTATDLWAADQVSDSYFIQAVQYLDSQGMIDTGNKTQESMSEHVPPWFKKSAAFWSEGLTSDNEFLQAIQFLVNKKIIME